MQEHTPPENFSSELTDFQFHTGNTGSSETALDFMKLDFHHFFTFSQAGLGETQREKRRLS